MKKIIPILFLFLTFSSTFGQLPNSNSDSILFEKKVQNLKKALSELELNSSQLNDSLKNEILTFKAREDYLSVALEDQASRFSLIVTGLLALAAFVGFSVYKIEILRLKKFVNKKMRKQQREFENYKVKMDKIDANLRSSSANTFVTIARLFQKDNLHELSFEFFISAAKSHAKSLLIVTEIVEKSNEENDDLKNKRIDNGVRLVKECLELADKSMNKLIELEDNSKKEYLERIAEDKIYKNIDSLYEISNKEINELTASLRVKTNNYLNQ